MERESEKLSIRDPMMDDTKNTDDSTNNKHKKIIIIAVICAVVIVALGLTLFFVLRDDSDEEKKDDSIPECPECGLSMEELKQRTDPKYLGTIKLLEPDSPEYAALDQKDKEAAAENVRYVVFFRHHSASSSSASSRKLTGRKPSLQEIMADFGFFIQPS